MDNVKNRQQSPSRTEAADSESLLGLTKTQDTLSVL